MIDRLPSAELEQAREGRFYQALIAELIQRRAAAVDRMVSLATNGACEDLRIVANAGRAACCEDLIKLLEQTKGRDE